MTRPPARPAMPLAWLLACLLPAFSGVAAADGDADGPAVPCEPAMPDNCWGDVFDSVDCLLNPRSPRAHQCQKQNATELCSVLEGALRCSSELVESGCEPRSGREGFDFWMRGLESVHTRLCYEGLMENVLSHAVCWDALRFARCVRHSVERLEHLVDLAALLHQHEPQGAQGAQGAQGRGPHEHCLGAMLRMAKCGALAAALDPAPAVPPPPGHDPALPYSFCGQAPPVDVIDELLAAYFSASECGVAGTAACAPPRHLEGQPPTPPAAPPAPSAPAAPAPRCESAATAPRLSALPLAVVALVGIASL